MLFLMITHKASEELWHSFCFLLLPLIKQKKGVIKLKLRVWQISMHNQKLKMKLTEMYKASCTATKFWMLG